jgi:hypothetical protein
MEETLNQSRATAESSDRGRDESAAETAVRAVARLLANPRRTRRD